MSRIPLLPAPTGIVVLAIAVVLAFFLGERLFAPTQKLATQKATAAGEGKPKSNPVRRTQVGRASWYSLPSKTANGEQMNSEDTFHPFVLGFRDAVHLTLPSDVVLKLSDQREDTHNKLACA